MLRERCSKPYSRTRPSTFVSVVDLQHLLRFVQHLQPLAMMAWTVTGGNPYFSRKLVENMVLEGTLFPQESGNWKYKPQSLVATSQLGNVVDLLVSKIRLLKSDTQVLLVVASALGHIIRQDVLENLLDSTKRVDGFPSSFVDQTRSQLSFHDGLQDAQDHGLIHEVEQGFRFTHDRVTSFSPRARQGARLWPRWEK